jgi:hypothetical protein
MRSPLRIVPAVLAGGLLWLGAAATGRAQMAVPGPAWSGYNPGYAWGVPSTGVRYAPGVTYYNYSPGYTYTAPAATYRPPGAGWVGYAPGTAWAGYAPGTSWRYIDPNAGGRPIIVRGPVTGVAPSRAAPISRGYREFGSGRPVPLAKPWLPGSP